jgi:hypothetical protein
MRKSSSSAASEDGRDRKKSRHNIECEFEENTPEMSHRSSLKQMMEEDTEISQRFEKRLNRLDWKINILLVFVAVLLLATLSNTFMLARIPTQAPACRGP